MPPRRLLGTHAAAVAAVLISLFGASAKRRKQHIVVCNGFADVHPVVVGVRLASGPSPPAPPPGDSLEGGTTLSMSMSELQEPSLLTSSHSAVERRVGDVARSFAVGGPSRKSHDFDHEDHKRLRVHRSAFGLHTANEALWTRSLAYGACEEVYVDLDHRHLFFLGPRSSTECAMAAENVEQASGSPTLVAVVAQPSASVARCVVRTAAAERPDLSQTHTAVAVSHAPPPAQLVTVDAFASSDTGLAAWEDRLFEDTGDRLLGGGGSVALRLEDTVEESSVTSEVIASRTVDFGHAFQVDPGVFHVVLEDQVTNRILDHRQASFAAGATVIAIRLGRDGDPASPEKVLLYHCLHDGPEDLGWRFL